MSFLFRLSLPKLDPQDSYGMYTEAIVAANSENDARSIHPDPTIFSAEITNDNDMKEEVWMYKNPEGKEMVSILSNIKWLAFKERYRLKIEKIGENTAEGSAAIKNKKRGVVSSKYIDFPAEENVNEEKRIKEIMSIINEKSTEFKLGNKKIMKK